MIKLQKYAKAIVAALLLGVWVIAGFLGVETGIDPEAQIQAIIGALTVLIGVYAVPNKDDDDV